MRTVNSFVGQPIERLEDLRLVRGRGQYVDDLARKGMLYAAVLRSSVSHGRVRSIDTSAAKALPGVHAIITAADIAAASGNKIPVVPMRLQPMPEFAPFAQPVMARDKVRYVGEALAMVLADTAGIAEDALGAIDIDIEPLPAVWNWKLASENETLLFEDAGTNVTMKFRAALGDAAAAFRGAPYTRRERFSTQRHTALPMEPRGVLAEWDAAQGRLTVWGAAKVLFANRRILAKQMGIAEAAIDMVENDVGGGFGARGEFYPEDFLIPFAARHCGRPVKWTEDRREHLMTVNHAREAACEVEIACERDGTILGLRGHAFVDMGAYMRTNGAIGARNIPQFMSGPYRIPNIDIDTTLLLTNKTPVGTYRGPGRFETDFFRERLFDMVARDLGIDQVEFRRRNLVREAEMPYTLATIAPFEAKDELDSGDYQVTLDRCLAEIGWVEKITKLQGKLIDGRYHGLSVACFIEGGAAGPKETARLVLESDGTLTVYMGSSGVGQGLETAFAQIAADAMEMPMDRINNVFHGSTAYVSDGYGAYHSRSIVMGGSAVVDAATKLREMMRAEAARRLNCGATEVVLADGRATAPGGKSVSWGELAPEPISVEGAFLNHKHTWAYGAHAAHVSVDPKTGHVALHDYVAVENCGRMINPLTLKGQLVGAVVQGLGGAFLEHLIYDDHGQLLTGSLADYMVPTASDFPIIRGYVMESHPSPLNPLGAKGAGEGGIISVGGIISNAIANALSSLGVEPRDLPLSPPRLWQLIQDARNMDCARKRE